MQFIRMTIFTTMERNRAISVVSDALSLNGGWIVNHTLYSNMAATINFELPIEAIEQFKETLVEGDLSPKIEGSLPKGRGKDVRGNLSITFSHDEPDMRRDVPSFG